jgi:hypothetical protein
MTVPIRAALYLRVSTPRQAEHAARSLIRNGKARLTASHAATSLSRPTWNRERPPPTTAGPSSSA